ncbi:MAG: DsbA family protein [Pseudomonadota bacterium]|uniref:DsbA family protein n=1 Tax=Rhizorhabdus phycosphaerae TaxID=2711156 RepID=UPI0013EA18E1|nr:DsbA family protein [Rhizorhabdus phycosphaerae]
MTIAPARWAVIAALLLGMTGSAHSQQPRIARQDQSAGDMARRIRQAIMTDPIAPAVAPEGADVTIVLFSDYNCPYCRKVHPALQALLREDPKVRLLYRDWPIFGGASTEAARAAIAAEFQGRHTAFNEALMAAQGKLDSAAIRTAANRAGVDWTRLQKDLTARRQDIDALLGRSDRYARMLGLTGTPGLLIGPYLLPGAVGVAELRKVVAAVRARPET